MNDLRGSIWRKWDLQIHTPDTKLSDQYKARGQTDVWSTFIEYIKKSDVEIFGITDYFSIGGYETFINKTKDNQDFREKVFFPNIEFRLDISLNDAVEQLQCHLIFDNSCDIQRVKKFLSHLKLNNKKPDTSVCYCTEEDIVACGGYDKVSISKEELEKALKDEFGSDKSYLIVGVASGMGSLRAIPNSNIKKELADIFDQFCDLFFGNEDNREYYLKEDRYENKKIFSLPKPVISTSDCHSFQDIENFLGKKYVNDKGVLEKDITWIKADKTFEGLKQITYEPDERVAFGTEKPDIKKSYYTIDNIRFIDNSGFDNFASSYIPINHNLSTIIGGKSTGKSLLLYYIAKTIDLEEVINRLSNIPYYNEYNFEEDVNFNFEVVWGDGESTFLKNPPGSSVNNSRKILYIPQNYLNKLSEKNVKNKEALNKFVKDVLLQNLKAKEDYELKMSEVKNLAKIIPSSITNLFQIKDDIKELEEILKQLGEEDGIKKYLAQLQQDANEIKTKSGLSKQEIKDYEDLLKKDQDALREIEILSEDRKSIALFKQRAIQQVETLQEIRKEQIDYINDNEIREDFKKEIAGLNNLNLVLANSIEKVLSKIDNKVLSKKREEEAISKKLIPILAKVKLQTELSKKSEAIKLEQKKLDRIAIEKNNLESKKAIQEKEKKTLIDTYVNIFSQYEKIRNDFKKYEKNFEDISINVSVGFDEERFNYEVVDGCLNIFDIKKCIEGAEWKAEYKYKFDSTTHIKFITTIFNELLEGKIKTVNNRSQKEAVEKILKDYFDIDLKISYKNDSLDKMSPGKKGLVLLRLLIDLSVEEWPILLDQPEDDLDNRSIYDDLVAFIKTKKKKRQIIIVTHNPNLVVGSDAEQVIIANQDGQEKGRENKKYKFEYVSGSLENTFEIKETEEKAILFRKGVRQHVCEILEGGKEAFQKREKKYSFS